jgi:hypothetical protein
VKITIENCQSISNYVQKPKIIKRKKEKPSLEKSQSHNNSTPNFQALNSSRLHILQRKLDVYVNDLKVRKESVFKENNVQSYVYKICLTGGPNAGKTTSNY